MPKPVYGEIANNRDEPGGETRAMGRLLDIAAQASEVIRAQRLADTREDVHYVVVVLGVVANRGEDQAAVTIEKLVPSSVARATLQLNDPKGARADSHPGLRGT